MKKTGNRHIAQRQPGHKNPSTIMQHPDGDQGGVHYLRWLLYLFTDLRLALVGYNVGENAVIRYGNTVPPYPETRTYIRRVLEYYQQYLRTPFY